MEVIEEVLQRVTTTRRRLRAGLRGEDAHDRRQDGLRRAREIGEPASDRPRVRRARLAGTALGRARLDGARFGVQQRAALARRPSRERGRQRDRPPSRHPPPPGSKVGAK
jgi:hypothetical protein